MFDVAIVPPTAINCYDRAMRLIGNIIIPEAKLTRYLLVPQDQDDKSKFLARAGFTQENPEGLRQALLDLIANNDAIFDRREHHGKFYRVEGELQGINRVLLVVTIWLERADDGSFRFVTLFPKK
jgi:hypothetical protein